MSYSNDRQYRVRTEDHARDSRPAQQSPYEQWLGADVRDRQLVRRPTNTNMARRHDYGEIDYSGDEFSEDDTGAGQMVIRQPSRSTSQSMIRRPVQSQNFATEPRDRSRREAERHPNAEIYISADNWQTAEPAHVQVLQEEATIRRESPRQVRREYPNNDDAARLRNISRLEIEVAELEQRLRNCGSRSRSGHSSSSHGGNGFSHPIYRRTIYISSGVSRYDVDSGDDDDCPCCEGTCDC